jgi:hypothetical protein
MKSVRLNECTLNEVLGFLKTNEDILFVVDKEFNTDFLKEINSACGENISIHFCPNKNIRADLLRLIPNVKHLIISPEYESRLETIDELSEFSELLTLKLGMYVKNTISLKPLSKIKKLREFDFDDQGLENKSQYEFINNQVDLCKLHVKKLDFSLLSVNHAMKDLKVFRTMKNEQLLAEKYPNLVSFYLHADSQRTDFSFIQNFSEVEDVTINYNSHLTTFPVMKNPEKIKSICMLSCPNFEDIDSLLPYKSLESLCLTSYDKPLKLLPEDFIKLKQLKKLNKVYTEWGQKEIPEIVNKTYEETGWINTLLK